MANANENGKNSQNKFGGLYSYIRFGADNQVVAVQQTITAGGEGGTGNPAKATTSAANVVQFYGQHTTSAGEFAAAVTGGDIDQDGEVASLQPGGNFINWCKKDAFASLAGLKCAGLTTYVKEQNAFTAIKVVTGRIFFSNTISEMSGVQNLIANTGAPAGSSLEVKTTGMNKEFILASMYQS